MTKFKDNHRHFAETSHELAARLGQAARAPWEALLRVEAQAHEFSLMDANARRALEQIDRTFAEGARHFQEQLLNQQRLIQEQFLTQERLSRGIADHWTRHIEGIDKLLAELPGDTRRALTVLGEHGWYVDMAMPFQMLWELERLLEAGQVEDAEMWLAQYYRKRLTEIQEELTRKHPKRARIVTLAFQAHERGEYELSVPPLLAQADGVCQDLTSHLLFRTSHGVPVVATYVERLPADRWAAALLAPLTSLLPILASEGQRDPTSTELNRHTVLHGEALDYGTEVNSLKSISLLQYVSSVLGTDATAEES